MKNFSVFLAVISAALFGMATPVSKILLEDLNYFQLAGLLYLGAAAGLLPFLSREVYSKLGRLTEKTSREY